MTKEEIASAFSNGEFDQVMDFIAEDSIWEVVAEDRFEGREAILRNCQQVAAYFRSVTTRFTTLHVIAQGDKVVVSGTAEFLRNDRRVSFISACDLYEFSAAGQIQRITSYCITERP